MRSTLNTNVTTGLDMCKVCTEAVDCVALWIRPIFLEKVFTISASVTRFFGPTDDFVFGMRQIRRPFQGRRISRMPKTTLTWLSCFNMFGNYCFHYNVIIFRFQPRPSCCEKPPNRVESLEKGHLPDDWEDDLFILVPFPKVLHGKLCGFIFGVCAWWKDVKGIYTLIMYIITVQTFSEHISYLCKFYIAW